jgi:hypothetical protein
VERARDFLEAFDRGGVRVLVQTHVPGHPPGSPAPTEFDWFLLVTVGNSERVTRVETFLNRGQALQATGLGGR